MIEDQKQNLRNYFAGQALQGLIARSTDEELPQKINYLTKFAFLYADAMVQHSTLRNYKVEKPRCD